MIVVKEVFRNTLFTIFRFQQNTVVVCLLWRTLTLILVFCEQLPFVPSLNSYIQTWTWTLRLAQLPCESAADTDQLQRFQWRMEGQGLSYEVSLKWSFKELHVADQGWIHFLVCVCACFTVINHDQYCLMLPRTSSCYCCFFLYGTSFMSCESTFLFLCFTQTTGVFKGTGSFQAVLAVIVFDWHGRYFSLIVLFRRWLTINCFKAL